MECKACGYLRKLEYVEGKEIWTGGDEDFIEVYGDFHIPSPLGIFEPDIGVALYACPKCKTVILDG